MGLSTEGNLRLKIDLVSLIVGSKFTVFAFFLLCIGGQFANYKPAGGLYLEGRFNGGFLRCRFGGGGGGRIFGGAYFRNFTVFQVILLFR